MNPDTWNALHDGRVTTARRDGDRVTLAVRIGYLCGELPTASDTLTLTLTGCDLFRWTAYGEPPTDDPGRAVTDRLEVIRATPHPDGLGIDGGTGELDVRYTAATVTTAEGQEVSQPELESAAERYWAKWEARNRHDSN